MNETNTTPLDTDQASGTPAGTASVTGGRTITALAIMPDKTLLDERALASALNVSKRTVRRMVARHELPPPVRFGGKSTWLTGRVLAHVEARAERQARDAERAARKLDALA